MFFFFFKCVSIFYRTERLFCHCSFLYAKLRDVTYLIRTVISIYPLLSFHGLRRWKDFIIGVFDEAFLSFLTTYTQRHSYTRTHTYTEYCPPPPMDLLVVVPLRVFRIASRISSRSASSSANLFALPLSIVEKPITTCPVKRFEEKER